MEWRREQKGSCCLHASSGEAVERSTPRERVPAARSRGRDGQAALAAVAGQKERSAPWETLPAPADAPRRPWRLSRPSPSPPGPLRPSPVGGVPGSCGASAAAGPSRHRHLLCLFPRARLRPCPLRRASAAPARADPASGARTGPTQNAPRGASRSHRHSLPARADSEPAEARGRERPGMETRSPETAAPAPLGSGPFPRAGP